MGWGFTDGLALEEIDTSDGPGEPSGNGEHTLPEENRVDFLVSCYKRQKTGRISGSVDADNNKGLGLALGLVSTTLSKVIRLRLHLHMHHLPCHLVQFPCSPEN